MSAIADTGSLGSGITGGLKPWAPRLAALALLLLLPFRDTISDMVGIWSRSETFAHCFFVVPVAAFMLWDKSRRERAPAPRVCWGAALPLLVFGLAWFVSRLALIAVGEQLAMVGAFISGVWLLCGTRFAAYAAFPLGFLFLAVPFGEGLIPLLIEGTTDFVVFGLRAIGIPVYREANELVLPSGNWSVVTACSGIRYLLATCTVGLVYAFFSIPSALGRTGFLAFAVAVAVVGNWLRALGIVLLGHYSGNRLAVGADHLVYGWVFFGILIAFLLFVGEAVFSGCTSHSRVDAPPAASSSRLNPTNGWGASTLVGIAALVLALAGTSGSPAKAPDAPFTLSSIPGWTEVPTPQTGFEPDYRAAPEPLHKRFTNGVAYVDLFVYAFAEQAPGNEAYAATNVLVHESENRWKAVERGPSVLTSAGKSVPFEATLIEGSGGERWVARTLTLARGGWLEGVFSVKRQELLDRLLGRANTLVRIVMVTSAETESTGAPNGDSILDRFIDDSDPHLHDAFEAWVKAGVGSVDG